MIEEKTDADALGLPETFAYTLVEGGDWMPFGRRDGVLSRSGNPPPDPDGARVHSIMFANGSVWDAANGWNGGGKWKVSAEKMARLRAAWAQQTSNG